ncbi:MAG TPA: integration host factor subunit alpha [Proteobacteria bacterium]|nr:integration host factor subunit alpha [Pseudomonadota bacterium]
MTKADLVNAVYGRLGGLSKRETARLVDAVFDLIKEALKNGEKVKISGFGNFVVRYKKPRRGRNPRTGEPIEISARRVLVFKPSQILRKALREDVPAEKLETL